MKKIKILLIIVSILLILPMVRSDGDQQECLVPISTLDQSCIDWTCISWYTSTNSCEQWTKNQIRWNCQSWLYRSSRSCKSWSGNENSWSCSTFHASDNSCESWTGSTGSWNCASWYSSTNSCESWSSSDNSWSCLAWKYRSDQSCEHYSKSGTTWTCQSWKYQSTQSCSAWQCNSYSCIPDCSCSTNTCTGQTCDDGCDEQCQGQKQPNCLSPSIIDCGEPIISTNECDGCEGTGTYCSIGTCIDGQCEISSGSNEYFIYQEDPLFYQCTGSWDTTNGCSNLTDGDWDTFGHSQYGVDSSAYLYMDYEKPNNTTNRSKWQIKSGMLGDKNLSINQSCWLRGPLQLRIEVYFRSLSNSYSLYSCYNGNDWLEIEKSYGGPSFMVFEEAMWWHIQKFCIPDCPSQPTVACGEPITSTNECSGCEGTGTYCEGGSCIDGACDYDKQPPKIKKVTYEYDEYGNVIKTLNLGELGKSGDETYEYTEYLYNTNLWIVDKPKHAYILDNDDSTKVNEVWFRYDNYNYNQVPTKGDLTYKEYWLETGTNPIEEYSYNSYGNIIAEKNPKGYTATYDYDSTNTFLTRGTNPKNHQTNYNYNIVTGNMLSVTDPNGFTTEYKYDVFGRKIKEIQPYDTEDYPTIEIQYNLDGNAPEEIKVLEREVSGTSNTYDTYYYYDGLGNLVQTKQESDTSQLITIDLIYDNMLRVKEELNPYLSNTGYSLPSTSVKKKTYLYDPLGRIKKVTNPDDSIKTIVYDHWTTRSYNEENNKREVSYDAFDQIIFAKEFNNAEVYLTTYMYDALGNLKEIKDNQNNIISYNYDTLGRKTQLNDPDLGTWNYIYDINSNIITQTDSKGNTISLQYDELERVTSKSSSGITSNYEYDTEKIGTLYKITHPSLQKYCTYDNRFRLINEQKIIDGITFNTAYTYDSMDRLLSKTLPDNTIISYNYNDQGLVESISDVISDIDYNTLNQPTQRTYSNSLSTNFQYNTDNYRLNRVTTSNKQELSYNYDNAGNVLEITDSINSKTSSFAYDDLDRLTRAQRTSDFDITYEYDSIGNMLSANSDKSNMILFYTSSPVHAPTKIGYEEYTSTINIDLYQGWNLISTPLIPTNNALPDALESIDGSYTIVWAYKAEDTLNPWKSFNPLTPPIFNDLNSIEPRYGYWIKMENEDTLTINGTDVPEGYTIPLVEGYNLIGMPMVSNKDYTLPTTLSSIDGNYAIVWAYKAEDASDEWKSFNPLTPSIFNDLNSIEPRYGYWIKMENEDTLEIS